MGVLGCVWVYLSMCRGRGGSRSGCVWMCLDVCVDVFVDECVDV